MGLLATVGNKETGLATRQKVNAAIGAINDGSVQVPAASAGGAHSRPGEPGDYFGTSQYGTPASITPIADANKGPFGNSRVALIVGGGVIARRQPYRIEPGRAYRLRVVLTRRTDTSDPDGDAVRIGLVWIGSGYATLSTKVVEDLTSVTVSAGRIEKVYDFPSDDVPVTIGYVRPFVQAFGGDGVTAVELVDLFDATDLIHYTPDLSGINAQIAALQTEIDNIEVGAGTYPEAVNVAEYYQADDGANLGPAIERALDAAAADGGKRAIWFENDRDWLVTTVGEPVGGETTIRGLFALRDGISIYSNGAKITLSGGRNNAPGLFYHNFYDTPVIDNIEIAGLVLDGSSDDQTYDTASQFSHAVQINSGTNIHVHDNRFLNWLGDGCLFGNVFNATQDAFLTRNVRVHDCEFDNIRREGLIFCATIGYKAYNNWFHGDGYIVAAIDVERHHANDTVTDGDIWSNRFDFTDGDGPIERGVSKKFRRAVSFGFFYDGYTDNIADDRFKNHRVHDNTILQGQIDSWRCKDVDIYDNNFYNLIFEDLTGVSRISPDTIRFFNTTPPTPKITGCTARRNKIVSVMDGRGIWVFDHENAIVDDNLVNGTRKSAVRFDFCTGRVSRTRAIDVGTSAAPVPAVDIAGGQGLIVAVENHASDSRASGSKGTTYTVEVTSQPPVNPTIADNVADGTISGAVKAYPGSEQAIIAYGNRTAAGAAWRSNVPIVVGDGTGAPNVQLDGASASSKYLDFRTAGKTGITMTMQGEGAGGGAYHDGDFSISEFDVATGAFLRNILQYLKASKTTTVNAGKFRLAGTYNAPLLLNDSIRLWDNAGEMMLAQSDPSNVDDGLHVETWQAIPPATPNAPGAAGRTAFDANFEYRCVSDGVWRRVALSSWAAPSPPPEPDDPDYQTETVILPLDSVTGGTFSGGILATASFPEASPKGHTSGLKLSTAPADGLGGWSWANAAFPTGDHFTLGDAALLGIWVWLPDDLPVGAAVGLTIGTDVTLANSQAIYWTYPRDCDYGWNLLLAAPDGDGTTEPGLTPWTKTGTIGPGDTITAALLTIGEPGGSPAGSRTVYLDGFERYDAAIAKGAIMIGFDGVDPSINSIALPLYQSAAIHGYVALDADPLPSDPVVKARIDQLYEAGWDVVLTGMHHTDYSVNPGLLSSEFDEAKAIFVDCGYTRALNFFAYPFGKYTHATDTTLIGKGVKMARTTFEHSIHSTRFSPGRLVNHGSIDIGGKSLATAKKYVDHCVKYGTSYNMFCHKIIPGGDGVTAPSDGLAFYQNDYEDLIDYMVTKRGADLLEIVPPSKWIDYHGL